MDSHDFARTRSSNSKSIIDDPSNPFYLHHSDGPGLVLVSQALNGDNYASWKRAMVIALSVKHKVGFIDGSIEKLDETDSILLNSWIRNNNIVISWILNSVSKDISASIIFSNLASEIWLDLQDRFQQSNGPRVFQLRRDLINLNQDQLSISNYFTKLKSLWEELSNYRPNCTCGKCTCGGVHDMHSYYQQEYIMIFLMGLNDSYAHVRGQILLMDPLPPINKVFSLISQEERQRRIGSPHPSNTESTNSVAFATKFDRRVSTNSSKHGQKKDRPYCTYCKYQGHTIEKCYKLH